MDHEHGFSLSFTTGSEWVRLLVVAGAALVITAALLRPFVPLGAGRPRSAVTVAAGVAILLDLLLADGVDMPGQAVVGLLALAAVPIAVTMVRRAPAAGTAAAPGPVTRHAPTAAPWVVGAGCVYVAVELGRAVLGADPAGHGGLVETGFVVGVAALSWLVLCRPRSRTATVATSLTGWVLGNLVLACLAVVATAGIPA